MSFLTGTLVTVLNRDLLDWVTGFAGVFIVLGTANSVLRTLVVPRGMRSIIAKLCVVSIRIPIQLFARRWTDYRSRDAILTPMASVLLVGLLWVWLSLFLLGYALIFQAVWSAGFADSVREAGSSLFTLGFASTNRVQLEFIDFIAAATGPIVIALMIGYLPAIYASYARRELEVALLHTRSGEPTWGPEVLARDTIAENTESQSLPKLWIDWERWAADVAQSHTIYPILIFTRSARPNQNWMVALLAVMDSAAMQLALRPGVHERAARVVLRQGIETMRAIATPIGIPFQSDCSGLRHENGDWSIQLTFDQYAEAVAMLDDAGYQRETTAEQSWPTFASWRVNYEAIAYALLMRIDAVPALWSGSRKPPGPQIPPIRATYVNRDGPPDGADTAGP